MPSKRSHGEGTLRHRSDGRWELRMMDGYQKDGSPRFKTFYGKTQKEVKLKLKEYQDALISGVQLDTILYFEDWADTWFDSCFSFQGKFFHFLTINRHRKIEYDLLYPASVFPFLREHLNSLDKGLHKLLLLRFRCGMVDFIKCQ